MPIGETGWLQNTEISGSVKQEYRLVWFESIVMTKCLVWMFDNSVL